MTTDYERGYRDGVEAAAKVAATITGEETLLGFRLISHGTIERAIRSLAPAQGVGTATTVPGTVPGSWLEKAILGTRSEPCAACGSTAIPAPPAEKGCPDCKGKGGRYVYDAGGAPLIGKCLRCGGTGKAK
jgi:hypothetical protein